MNVLALCAGVGGLELGIRIAEPRARGVCYVEREAYAAAILAARMEDGWLHPAPIWSDLGTFDPEPWRGIVDCITSGDPCQPNSLAGKQLGKDDDRWLVDRVLSVVEAIRPRRFFRENVPGNADGQLEAIIPALEGMGYRVAAGIFSAEEVGASHRRGRLFIMADARRAGLQGREWYETYEERDGPKAPGPAPKLCGLYMEPGNYPIFAPGPADLRWPQIIRNHPALEPAVCRMADGVANRVDRLRAGGNGVFPMAAAHAWLSLDALLRAG